MRKFKKELLDYLKREDFESGLKDIHLLSPKKALNTLFLFLCSTKPDIKNNAAIAIGEVVSRIAREDIEYARIIFRRLMVTLTEESGGIGWGAPLAMGEIMARNKQLADEFHKILISYAIVEGENYLDFEGLQKDVKAGLKRLSQVRPELVEEVKHLIE